MNTTGSRYVLSMGERPWVVRRATHPAVRLVYWLAQGAQGTELEPLYVTGKEQAAADAEEGAG